MEPVYLMRLPIELNSRTFVRNFTPNAYPAGTRRGLDWEVFGGIWDNTDARNVIYWGPPRPVNDDPEYGLLPGETPANAVRRLKIAGYVGLYSARAEQERKRLEGQAQPTRPASGLERIAAAVRERRDRSGLTVVRAAAREGRRPTRAELREQGRKQEREGFLNGEPLRGGKVPQVVGVGLGNPEHDPELEELSDREGDDAGELEDEEADPTDAQDGGMGGDITTEGGATFPELPTPARPVPAAPPVTERPAPPVAATPAPPEGEPSAPPAPGEPDDPETFPDEDGDAPVGGGGKAATTPNPAPAQEAPQKPAGTPAGGKKGGGLAGGGSRRRKTAEQTQEPAPANV